MFFLVNVLQFRAKMNLFSWSDHSVPFLTCRIKIKMCFYLCRMFGYLHISTSSSSSLDFVVCVVFTSENTSCSHTHFLFLHPLWLLTPCSQTRPCIQSLFLTCFVSSPCGRFPCHVSFCLPEPVRTPRICPAGKCWVTGQAGCLLEFWALTLLFCFRVSQQSVKMDLTVMSS